MAAKKTVGTKKEAKAAKTLPISRNKTPTMKATQTETGSNEKSTAPTEGRAKRTAASNNKCWASLVPTKRSLSQSSCDDSSDKIGARSRSQSQSGSRRKEATPQTKAGSKEIPSSGRKAPTKRQGSQVKAPEAKKGTPSSHSTRHNKAKSESEPAPADGGVVSGTPDAPNKDTASQRKGRAAAKAQVIVKTDSNTSGKGRKKDNSVAKMGNDRMAEGGKRTKSGQVPLKVEATQRRNTRTRSNNASSSKIDEKSGKNEVVVGTGRSKVESKSRKETEKKAESNVGKRSQPTQSTKKEDAKNQDDSTAVAKEPNGRSQRASRGKSVDANGTSTATDSDRKAKRIALENVNKKENVVSASKAKESLMVKANDSKMVETSRTSRRNVSKNGTQGKDNPASAAEPKRTRKKAPSQEDPNKLENKTRSKRNAKEPEIKVPQVIEPARTSRRCDRVLSAMGTPSGSESSAKDPNSNGSVTRRTRNIAPDKTDANNQQQASGSKLRGRKATDNKLKSESASAKTSDECPQPQDTDEVSFKGRNSSRSKSSVENSTGVEPVRQSRRKRKASPTPAQSAEDVKDDLSTKSSSKRKGTGIKPKGKSPVIRSDNQNVASEATSAVAVNETRKSMGDRPSDKTRPNKETEASAVEKQDLAPSTDDAEKSKADRQAVITSDDIEDDIAAGLRKTTFTRVSRQVNVKASKTTAAEQVLGKRKMRIGQDEAETASPRKKALMSTTTTATETKKQMLPDKNKKSLCSTAILKLLDSDVGTEDPAELDEDLVDDNEQDSWIDEPSIEQPNLSKNITVNNKKTKKNTKKAPTPTKARLSTSYSRVVRPTDSSLTFPSKQPVWKNVQNSSTMLDDGKDVFDPTNYGVEEFGPEKTKQKKKRKAPTKKKAGGFLQAPLKPVAFNSSNKFFKYPLVTPKQGDIPKTSKQNVRIFSPTKRQHNRSKVRPEVMSYSSDFSTGAQDFFDSHYGGDDEATATRLQDSTTPHPILPTVDEADHYSADCLPPSPPPPNEDDFNNDEEPQRRPPVAVGQNIPRVAIEGSTPPVKAKAAIASIADKKKLAVGGSSKSSYTTPAIPKKISKLQSEKSSTPLLQKPAKPEPTKPLTKEELIRTAFGFDDTDEESCEEGDSLSISPVRKERVPGMSLLELSAISNITTSQCRYSTLGNSVSLAPKSYLKTSNDSQYVTGKDLPPRFNPGPMVVNTVELQLAALLRRKKEECYQRQRLQSQHKNRKMKPGTRVSPRKSVSMIVAPSSMLPVQTSSQTGGEPRSAVAGLPVRAEAVPQPTANSNLSIYDEPEIEVPPQRPHAEMDQFDCGEEGSAEQATGPASHQRPLTEVNKTATATEPKKNAFELMKQGPDKSLAVNNKVKKLTKKRNKEEQQSGSRLEQSSIIDVLNKNKENVNDRKKLSVSRTYVRRNNKSVSKNQSLMNFSSNDGPSSPRPKLGKKNKKYEEWATNQTSHFSEVDEFDLTFG